MMHCMPYHRASCDDLQRCERTMQKLQWKKKTTTLASSPLQLCSHMETHSHAVHYFFSDLVPFKTWCSLLASSCTGRANEQRFMDATNLQILQIQVNELNVKSDTVLFVKSFTMWSRERGKCHWYWGDWERGREATWWRSRVRERERQWGRGRGTWSPAQSPPSLLCAEFVLVMQGSHFDLQLSLSAQV